MHAGIFSCSLVPLPVPSSTRRGLDKTFASSDPLYLNKDKDLAQPALWSRFEESLTYLSRARGEETEHEHQHTGVDMDVVFCPICTHVIRTHKSHLHAITIIIIGISNKSCQPPVPTLSADYHPFCRIPIYFHYSLPILKGLPIPLGFCFSRLFSNTIFHLRSSKPCEQ